MNFAQKRFTWDEMMIIPPEQIPQRSRVPIKIYAEADQIFKDLTGYILSLIKESNRTGKLLRLGWPIGPKKHFPLLAKITNEEKISWKKVVIFQVDEWLSWDCRPLPANHPFNLQSYLKHELIDKIDPALRPSKEQVIFHNPLQLDTVDRKIDEYGGIDILFGGIGYTGHIAFNEPPTSRWTAITEGEYRNARSRFVNVNEETIIMHSHRSTGGNPRLIPPVAMTIGMKDILGAHKIRLYSDGGSWKQTITRILCFHEPTIQFPCTFVQGHPDVELHVDAATAECPPIAFTG
jgi:glucosamine-6-phosphate deaminase